MQAQHKEPKRRPQLAVVPVDLNAYRVAKEQRAAKQQLISERSQVNGMIAERVIEQWDVRSGGFDRDFFYYVLRRVSEHTVFTLQQAKVVLPALLEVNDEIDRLETKKRVA